MMHQEMQLLQQLVIRMQTQVLIQPFVMPADTVMGALARYISDGSVTDFQPMGANFGILPPLGERIRSKQERYEKISQRGLESARKYIEGENEE